MVCANKPYSELQNFKPNRDGNGNSIHDVLKITGNFKARLHACKLEHTLQFRWTYGRHFASYEMRELNKFVIQTIDNCFLLQRKKNKKTLNSLATNYWVHMDLNVIEDVVLTFCKI